MKKLSCICLALCMSAAFIFAPAESLLAGEWYLSAIEAEGIRMSPAGVGLDMQLTFYEDGSILILGSKEGGRKGVWLRQEGTIVADADGDRMIFLMQGETLSFRDEEKGLLMIFERERGRQAQADPAGQLPSGEASPVRIDAVLDDFDGGWRPVRVEVMGRLMEAEPLGFTQKIIIRQGLVSFTGKEDAPAPSFEGELKEGALILKPGEEWEDEELVLRLHEDGRMSYVSMEQVRVYLEHEGR